jgi:hypothetical protein
MNKKAIALIILVAAFAVLYIFMDKHNEETNKTFESTDNKKTFIASLPGQFTKAVYFDVPVFSNFVPTQKNRIQPVGTIAWVEYDSTDPLNNHDLSVTIWDVTATSSEKTPEWVGEKNQYGFLHSAVSYSESEKTHTFYSKSDTGLLMLVEIAGAQDAGVAVQAIAKTIWDSIHFDFDPAFMSADPTPQIKINTTYRINGASVSYEEFLALKNNVTIDQDSKTSSEYESEPGVPGGSETTFQARDTRTGKKYVYTEAVSTGGAYETYVFDEVK